MYMDDIKIFSKKEKELVISTQTLRIYSQDLGMRFDIGKYAMLIIKM